MLLRCHVMIGQEHEKNISPEGKQNMIFFQSTMTVLHFMDQILKITISKFQFKNPKSIAIPIEVNISR